MHIQNSLRLDFAQFEACDQILFGGFHILGFTDSADDLVQVIEGDEQTIQNVSPGLGFSQFIFRTTGNDVLAMFDVDLQRPFE
ncbi:hypothetical protein SDC9_65842 [bioreactor metagenome]|uniref:Uncharacterized protein n=1 Tax=bioreactor metagenome TaxID=1076179 RepID=A0A644XUG5_9ZZZZ